jgi:hypothetical protein
LLTSFGAAVTFPGVIATRYSTKQNKAAIRGRAP